MKKIIILTAAILTTACSDASTRTDTTDGPAQFNWTETDIQNGELGGTYVNVGVRTPVIIMVPGSGPTDKDGNNQGMVSNALKSLAHGLADHGISSVRVDKRGMFSSANAGNPNQVSVEIYADDYRKWVQTVMETSGQNCVYLLGHSEGGLMVSAAAIDQANICGVITIASPGYRLSDVLRKQLKDNPANAPILADAMAAIDSLEAGKPVDVENMHPALSQLFGPAVQDYLISLFSVDPADLLAKVQKPKLVIQGSHDIQVTVEDAERLAATSGAGLVVLEGISHVLKPAPEDRMANIKTYNSPDTPVDPDVINAIVQFISD